MRIDTNIIFAVPITHAEIIVELGPRGCVGFVYLPRGSATVLFDVSSNKMHNAFDHEERKKR